MESKGVIRATAPMLTVPDLPPSLWWSSDCCLAWSSASRRPTSTSASAPCRHCRLSGSRCSLPPSPPRGTSSGSAGWAAAAAPVGRQPRICPGRTPRSSRRWPSSGPSASTAGVAPPHCNSGGSYYSYLSLGSLSIHKVSNFELSSSIIPKKSVLYVLVSTHPAAAALSQFLSWCCVRPWKEPCLRC